MKARSMNPVLVVLVVVLALPMVPLFAQEQPPPQQPQTAEEEKKPKTSEEIVVTARKQEETVQEAPISVAAPTESQLRDRGAETLEDVAVNVAGFNVQNAGPGQSQVGMRGVSAGRIIRDQPGVKEQVGIYLDESVISLSLFTPDVDLFDMSRIEVLRGPQGTLFGSGSLAGTVRYITNQPTLGSDEKTGEVSVNNTSGDFGGSVKAAINAPLGANAAMRAVGYYTRYAGFIDAVQPNLTVNEGVNDGDRKGARVAFLFKPAPKWSITPRILYQDVKMNGWNRIDVFNILANPVTTTRPKVDLGERQQFTQLKEPFTDKFLLGDVNLSYDLGKTTLTAITSYTDRDILVVRDATALTASITGGSFALPASVYTINAPLYDKTGAKSWTQEVRLSSNGKNKLNWVAGAFYSDSKRDYGQNLPVLGFEAACKATGAAICAAITPTKGTKIANTDELFKSDLHYDYNQFALFGEGTFAVTDKLDITAGARYYDFKEDRKQIFDGIFADPTDAVGGVNATGFAPRVILSYKLSDNTRLNAQVSKGFRLGGINDPLNLPLCTPQDLVIYGGHNAWSDETLWDYEAGVKTTVMGGKGTFNASAYYNDIKDLQATLTAGSCSSRIVVNVPKARTTGVEAEFEAVPNDSFDFAISGNFNNSELKSDFKSSTGAVVAGIKSGNRLPSVPEVQLAAAATYRWQMHSGMAGYLTGVYQHIGDRYTQISDQEVGFGTVDISSFPGDIGGPYTQNIFTFNPKLPAYDTVNVRVGVLKGAWDTALFVNNITDERAFLALDIERGDRARVSYMTNIPRTVGVSTRFNF